MEINVQVQQRNGMTPLDMISTCAPLVAPVTIAAVVQRESGGNPLAVHDNATGVSHRPQTEAEAIALAKSLIALGHSVDLGLGQINSRNLPWLGQSVETIFEPCGNLTAMQGVLLAAWKQSGGSLPGALSIYNTGKAGGAAGASYAATVYAQARQPAPAVTAIPAGKLPPWVSRGFGTASAIRASARKTGAVALADAPAISALKPDAGDLKPGASRD
jgi:type IV secretion system protein VirB1